MWRSPALITVMIALVAGAVVAGVGAGTARPGDASLYPPAPCEPHLVMFLSRNAYHAELALPATWLRSQGGPTAEALSTLPPTPWVLIGWGDARFYRQAGWSVGRIRGALRALWPDNPSVIRLTPLNRAPDLAFRRGILRIELSEAGAKRLLQRLDHSFRTVGGRPLQVPALQAGDEAAYFESVERFSVAKTCNEWIGQILDAAGVATTPILDAAPQSLMWDVLRAGAPRQCRAPRRSGSDLDW